MNSYHKVANYFENMSTGGKVLFCAGTVLAYGIVFWLFYPFISRSAIVLVLPLVLLIASVFGWLGGLLSGVLAIPLDLSLYALEGNARLIGAAARNFWLSHIGFIVVGLLVGYLRDVRERLRVEISVRERLEQELRQSLKKYQKIVRQADLTQEQLQLHITALEAAANGIVITDKNGVIQWANLAFAELTGYAEAEIIGNKLSMLKSGEHDTDFYKDLWRTIIAGEVWQGTIVNRRKDGTFYIEEQTITPVRGANGEISRFVAIKQDVSDRVRAEKKLEYLATHDPLTKLPNRALFYDRLEHAIQRAKRRDRYIGILFLDLDDFKEVNDAFGHHYGDDLLRAVGGRLQEATRESDTVSRVGGDEFTLILEELDKPDAAGKVAQKIINALARPYTVNGNEVQVGVSIGISLYPRDGADADGLVNKADAAMYRAKQGGKNRMEYYRE